MPTWLVVALTYIGALWVLEEMRVSRVLRRMNRYNTYARRNTYGLVSLYGCIVSTVVLACYLIFH